jgi:hypothetical protein
VGEGVFLMKIKTKGWTPLEEKTVGLLKPDLMLFKVGVRPLEEEEIILVSRTSRVVVVVVNPPHQEQN